jgi:uncharacterized coiled-coil DUF342 family protein
MTSYMSRENLNPPQNSKDSFQDLQSQIEEFRKKRDNLNDKTKDYISKLQNLDSEINNYLKIAKDNYKKKRDYWNEKVGKLKDKKIEYKKMLESTINEKRKAQGFTNNNSTENKFRSIKQIERKIEGLERVIETENLDISEENAIIDKIKELMGEKQEYLVEQQNSDTFKIERKIQIIKINLNKIYEQLNKWSNKSQNYHSKMQDTYQIVNELKAQKKKVEEDLIENKKAADNFHDKFLRLMNQKKKISRGKRPYKSSSKRHKRYYKTNSKQEEKLEKMKQDKLATALEKQKAGKKLNLYEARLILEKSKD